MKFFAPGRSSGPGRLAGLAADAQPPAPALASEIREVLSTPMTVAISASLCLKGGSGSAEDLATKIDNTQENISCRFVKTLREHQLIDLLSQVSDADFANLCIKPCFIQVRVKRRELVHKTDRLFVREVVSIPQVYFVCHDVTSENLIVGFVSQHMAKSWENRTWALRGSVCAEAAAPQ